MWVLPTMGRTPGGEDDGTGGAVDGGDIRGVQLAVCSNTLWVFTKMGRKPGERMMGQLERWTEAISGEFNSQEPPSEQRLNRECSSSSCVQMQTGWVFSMDSCRTVHSRLYVPSRVCWSSHQLHWFKLVNRLSSDSYR